MNIYSPQLGLAPKSILGGEVFDREVIVGLAKLGVDIRVLLPYKSPVPLGVKNLKAEFLPAAHFPPILFNLLIIPQLIKGYYFKKFQILRLHQPQYTGFAAIILKSFFHDIKIVATYHQFRESNFNFLSKKINNYWDHIICDSDAVKNKISASYGIAESKITVVHNGVPSYLRVTSRDKKLENKMKLKNKIVLLYYGLFVERKNPLFLLSVLAEIKKKYKDVVVIFWGSGPLKEEILMKAEELELTDSIRIQKPIFGRDKNKIHSLTDILVHPALDEGFALAPLESMACGKPVVITNAFSGAEVVENGVNGFLCNLNDKQEWSEAITKLIEDKNLRSNMGKESRKRVNRDFQWQTTVKRHYNVFRNLIKK